MVPSFGEKIREEKLLPKVPEKIWCEKLLCESDKAFHIWGKVIDSQQNHAMWLPKSAIVQEEKKLNRVIDYSPYHKRPPMEHQKVAIEKLLARQLIMIEKQQQRGGKKPIDPRGFILMDDCLSKKGATECFPFDESTLVFKVMGKMFALTGLEHHPSTVNLKCDPERAIDLRERHEDVRPGYHMNKRHWNTLSLRGSLNSKQIFELIAMQDVKLLKPKIMAWVDVNWNFYNPGTT